MHSFASSSGCGKDPAMQTGEKPLHTRHALSSRCGRLSDDIRRIGRHLRSAATPGISALKCQETACCGPGGESGTRIIGVSITRGAEVRSRCAMAVSRNLARVRLSSSTVVGSCRSCPDEGAGWGCLGVLMPGRAILERAVCGCQRRFSSGSRSASAYSRSPDCRWGAPGAFQRESWAGSIWCLGRWRRWIW